MSGVAAISERSLTKRRLPPYSALKKRRHPPNYPEDGSILTVSPSDPKDFPMPSVFQRRAAAQNPAMVLAIILGCYLMVVLDASVVITALPDIRLDLGFSPAGLSWVQNIYALAFGGLLLLGARMGDLLG